MTAQPPGSPPPGFRVPPPRFTNTVPIARPPQSEGRSEIQDSVPQDAPYSPVGAAVAPKEPRWSGKRTAAIAALALALTTAGALAAAHASPNGIQAPTEQRGGPGFGPGGGRPNRQFGPGGAPGQQGQQGGPRQRFQQQQPANPQQNGSGGATGRNVTT